MPESSDNECQCPCDPESGCPECAEYWNRMVREGYWDLQKHRWTHKGWNEIISHA